MDSERSKLRVALLLLPAALLLVGAAAAQDDSDDDRSDRSTAPDLVITEDSQIALLGKTGKAVIGSCKTDDPLWKGKIAIKNIGGAKVLANPPPAARLEPQRALDWPHVRTYVPNNIQLKAEARLANDLGEFGQELVELEIGAGEPKCRNYDAPPVFDERLSGLPGPLRAERGPSRDDGPGPEDRYAWRIKKIQRALIDKGYQLSNGADGDFGPQSVRAALSYFKSINRPPPPDLYRRPLPPETVAILLEALRVGSEDEEEENVPVKAAVGRDECLRGINLVPIYIEIDPERQIEHENTSNNRVQFTVAIDCSNIAR